MGLCRRSIVPSRPGRETLPPTESSVQIPAGLVAFHVASSSSPGAYRKAYDHESVITIPPDGQRELLLKIPHKRGFWSSWNPPNRGRCNGLVMAETSSLKSLHKTCSFLLVGGSGRMRA